MTNRCFQCLIVAFLLSLMTTVSTADDSKEKAIQKDRKKIEGTWRVASLVVNGKKAKEEDAEKIAVVNGSDGTWRILVEGQEISKGTSTLDPTKKPKTIEFTPAEGEGAGNRYLGIYELGKDTRKLCFAQEGMDRPTEFFSAPGSGHALVAFERVDSK